MYLSEELLELVGSGDLVRRFHSAFTQRLLEELGHFNANFEQLALLLVLPECSVASV